MAFIRKIKKSSGTYLAKVESYRHEGKVKQRVIEYLGKQVKGKAVKKVYSNDIEVKQVKQYLDIVVIDQIAKELELHKLLGEHSAYILILIYSHLLTRSSINKLPDWLKQTEMQEILNLKNISSKKIYEALDYMNILDMNKIEKAISLKWEKYEDIKNMLVLDITDTYFNGSHADWKSRRGKDGKYSKLMQIALAVSFNEGFPLFHNIYEGNINNIKIFQDMLSDIRALKYKGVILDRGMYSKENIEEIINCQLTAITGVRLYKSIQREYIDKLEREEIYSKAHEVKLKDTIVYIEDFPYYNGTLIAVYNPKLEVIKRGQHLYQNKPQSEAKYLGYSMLFNNTNLDSKTAVKKYFEKDIVERSFKQIKGILSLRPVRVWLMNHIEAHIKICYLSYSILSLLNYKLKSLDINSVEVLDLLKTAYKVYLNDKNAGFEWGKVVTLTNQQKVILKHLNVVYKN